MPKNTNRPYGTSGKESLQLSGGEQFFMRQEVDPAVPPFEFIISYARMSSGAEFPGLQDYKGGSNAAPGAVWTNGVLNYVWCRISQVTVAPFYGVEAGTGGFPDEPDVIPLWILDINGGGTVTALLDARPWFDGGAGGGANSIEERLKEILQHSVMEDYFFDSIASSDNVDGSSTGSFLGPNRYELDPGDVLLSNFTASAPDHLAVINQPYVAVLTDQIINPTTDIQIWISRTVGGPPAFPGPEWVAAPSNFSLVDMTGAPGTNGLNIRIRNSGATTYEVVGWGIYSNPITAPGGVLVPKTGIHVGGTGLDVYNTNPAAYRTSSAAFAMSWNANTDTLSWTGVGVGDDLVIEITDDVTGTIERNLAAPGSLPGVIAGSYVYFDIDRNDAPNSPITLQVSAGAPIMLKDRFILGKRVANPNAGDDVFVLWNNHIMYDSVTTPLSVNLTVPPPLMSNNMLGALFAANAPTGANPYATIADLAGIGGGFKNITAYGGGWSSPGVISTSYNWSAVGATAVLITASNGGRNENVGIYVPGSNAWYHSLYHGFGVAVSAFVGSTLLWDNFAPRVMIQQSGGVLSFSGDNGGGGLLAIGFG